VTGEPALTSLLRLAWMVSHVRRATSSLLHDIKASSNFGLKLIQAKFSQASYSPLMVGTSDFADGQKGKFPFELVLRPVAKVERLCAVPQESPVRSEAGAGGLRCLSIFGSGSIVQLPQPSAMRCDEQLFFKHRTWRMTSSCSQTGLMRLTQRRNVA